jgi:hypothetical protein
MSLILLHLSISGISKLPEESTQQQTPFFGEPLLWI